MRKRIPGMRRPRNGKIARLPAAVRVLLNLKLRDNLTAAKIVSWLKTEHPEAVKEAELGEDMVRNISNWRQGGYAEWELQQARLADMRAQQEFAFELARQSNGSVQAASQAMAASQIYEILQDFNLRYLKERLEEKPETYSLLITAISKLSRLGQGEKKLQLEFTKYQDKVAEQKRKLEHELGKAKRGGLTPEAIAMMEEALNLL